MTSAERERVDHEAAHGFHPPFIHGYDIYEVDREVDRAVSEGTLSPEDGARIIRAAVAAQDAGSAAVEDTLERSFLDTHHPSNESQAA